MSPIPDKAPDTPSRMRQPKMHSAASTESVSNKRPAENQPQLANKKTVVGTSTSAPKNTLNNPRTKPTSAVLPKTQTSLQPQLKSEWSMIQRLEDMERMMKEMHGSNGSSSVNNSNDFHILNAHLQLAEAKLTELQNAKTLIEEKLMKKESDLKQVSDELECVNKKMKILEEDSVATINRLKSSVCLDLDVIARERDSLKRENTSLSSSLDVAVQEAAALRSTLATQSATIIELKGQLDALRIRLDEANAGVTEKNIQVSTAVATIEQLNNELDIMKSKLNAGETARRKLHNDLQELKGNIRVFCRVRPLLSNEVHDAKNTVKVPGGHGIGEPEEIITEQTTESASGQPSTKMIKFAFDRVFPPETDQSVVFDEVSQLVQSALDGFRVCIFAYGQTGSGKTFTMEGSKDTPGVIPRAVEQIYLTADRLGERGWSFTMDASFLEIYNETIRDLLSETVNNSINHEIRHSGNKTTVSDLRVQNVSESDQVIKLLQLAAKNRAVAETQCNDRSSRSHSVFILRISGINSVTDERVEGILNLIDLAGSERLTSSGSTGDRLKETQAINKSLSALGDVIAALAAKESHIPYRNSKLTYLLQNSLGGNCKTLMFVNVSPVASSIPESLCSLRFATKVNSCHIGTARRNAVQK